MHPTRLFSTVLVLSLLLAVSSANPAHALDKRLKLLFKTAGYGAAAGLVVGAGTWALGMGGGKSAFMGASAGMYAGILLGSYIILSPREHWEDSRQGPRNPYDRQRPVGPDDWQDEEQDYDEYERQRRAHDGEGAMLLTPPSERLALLGEGARSGTHGALHFQETVGRPVLWLPVVSAAF